MTIEELSKLVALIFGAGGVTAGIGSLAGFVRRVSDGRAQEQRAKTQDLTKQRDDAWSRVALEQARADKAETETELHRRARQNLSDYAATLRRLLIEAGYPEDRLPPWPTNH